MRRPCATSPTGRHRRLGIHSQTKLTLVIYMGVNGAHQIEQGLLAGLPGATPAALIQDATLPTQCHTVTALAELHATLVREQFGSPCVIVVGDVLQGLLRL